MGHCLAGQSSGYDMTSLQTFLCHIAGRGHCLAGQSSGYTWPTCKHFLAILLVGGHCLAGQSSGYDMTSLQTFPGHIAGMGTLSSWPVKWV